VIDNRRILRAFGRHFGPLEHRTLLAALVDVFAPTPGASRAIPPDTPERLVLLVHFEYWLPHRRGYVSVRAGDRRGNRSLNLCQNCATYPPKPWGNTVIYGDTSTHIDVAEVVESEVRWWNLMCVSTRERIQFPSVAPFKALVSRRRIRSRIGWLPTAIQGQRGFKSCPEDRSPATVVVIELLPNGSAGARNHHYLQLWRLVA
jgi:hypothetical protein